MVQRFRLDRALVLVSGPDARVFLQGLVTQDVSRLSSEHLLYGALLSPQGKIVADMFLWRDDKEGAILDIDPARAGDLLRRLGMYKLRANVELKDITQSRSVVWSEAPFEGALADPRLPDGALGWRALAPAAATDTLSDGDAVLDRVRVTAGAPDLARDAAPEEVFALEALLEELHGVEFSKGCFVGQENVSRMKRRATTRRKFCPIAFAGPAPALGTPVLAGEAEIGTVRTGLDGRAIALVRLDRVREAAAKGERLTAAARDVSIDPPDWLIQPADPNLGSQGS